MVKNQKTRNNRHDQPLDVLSEMANMDILIRLVDRTEVIGRLLDFDQYMNLKISVKGEELLIRGNNVVLIGSDWEQTGAGEAGSPT